MNPLLRPVPLAAEDSAPTRAVTPRTRSFGFRPAFLDCATMRIYCPRLADGTPAPFHALDGLPDEAVADRLPSGRVARPKATLIAGFERGGFFYTRTAAARACTEWAPALRGSSTAPDAH